MDGRNGGLRKGREPLVDVAGVAVVGEDRRGSRIAELGHVGPRRERPALAGDHDGSARAELFRDERLTERDLNGSRERVELVRPPEHQHADISPPLDSDQFLRHAPIVP